jgi:chloramphenicol 3-O-phosphotransferase
MEHTAPPVSAQEGPVPQPVLVYLYGPPASGKLTIAERFATLSGYPLFHNHLTVNALTSVFAFGSKPFTQLLHKVRLDVFDAAARAGVSMIFTNNSAWRGADARARFCAFADEARRVFEVGGGRVQFVRVTAPLSVLEGRVDLESRRAHGKLLDSGALRDLVSGLDQTSLHPGDLVIDTSLVSPDEAALIVADSVNRLAILCF